MALALLREIETLQDMARANPVLPGFNPDPSITRVGNDFFLATSSFEYLPGVPIYHSKDLLQWKLIGHALTRRSQIRIAAPEPGGGVWAPTLRYHDNVFYLATSSFDRFRPQQDERVFPRGFYVKTTNIWDSSSWSDPVYFDMVGLDQDVSLRAFYFKLRRTCFVCISDANELSSSFGKTMEVCTCLPLT